MRRLFALALLLVPVLAWGAQSAQKHVIAVVPGFPSTTQSGTSFDGPEPNRNHQLVLKLMDRLGINYEAFRDTAPSLRTDFLSSGKVTRNFGLANPTVTSFDAAIWVGNPYPSGGPKTRSDSLMRMVYTRDDGTSGGPAIPMLFLIGDEAQGVVGGTSNLWSNDSTGAVGAAAVNPNSTFAFEIPGNPNAWLTAGNYGLALKVNKTAGPFGGVRKLIAASQPAQTSTSLNIGCGWCDSLLTRPAAGSWAINDTVSMWERLYIGGTGQRITYAYFDGAGTLSDSTGTDRSAEGDPTIILMGLAHLDSLLGNNLFDRDRLPLRRAITIDGLCSRRTRGQGPGNGGIFNADTANFYAVLDSIRLAGIPVTFGVNADPDSMSTYLRDIIKAAQNPLARFSPQIRTGLDTTVVSANAGLWNKFHPVDVWGRFRKRVCVGDGSGVGKDSSLYAGLLWSRYELDSTLTANGYRGRISRTLLAPDDDWSPFNLGGVNGVSTNTASAESVYFACTKAGYAALRTDVNGFSAMGVVPTSYHNASTNYGSTARTNPAGYSCRQETRLNPFNSLPLKLVGRTDSFRGGSLSQWVLQGTTKLEGCILSRLYTVWGGFLYDEDGGDLDGIGDPNDYLFFTGSAPDSFTVNAVQNGKISLSSILSPPRKAYCTRMFCNDLSGATVAGGDPPARSGWWVIKSINNAMQAINYFDGKTVIMLGYPEDINVDQ